MVSAAVAGGDPEYLLFLLFDEPLVAAPRRSPADGPLPSFSFGKAEYDRTEEDVELERDDPGSMGAESRPLAGRGRRERPVTVVGGGSGCEEDSWSDIASHWSSRETKGRLGDV